MKETAAFIALVETASAKGVEDRQRYLDQHGPHELGWSYANIMEVDGRLKRQIGRKGFFRLYLFIPDEVGGKVRFKMNITGFTTFRKEQSFNDPVDGHRYLVHSRMMIESIEELPVPVELTELRSIDERKPDTRHLQLGFLFVVDPEI